MVSMLLIDAPLSRLWVQKKSRQRSTNPFKKLGAGVSVPFKKVCRRWSEHFCNSWGGTAGGLMEFQFWEWVVFSEPIMKSITLP